MDRWTLVTGGTRGIGAKISIQMKQAGYQVIASYHSDEANAQSFSKEHNIPVHCFNVSDADACTKAMHHIEKTYGGIDVLVHNAGITRDAFLHKMDINQWHDVINTNLNSCFYVTCPLIEHMRTRGFGRIIFISSVNAQKGQLGQTNYSAAKAGMIGFVKALAQESAKKGITVNAIAPGYIETDMLRDVGGAILEQIKGQIPVGRLGNTLDVARAVLFLASKEASFITGSTLSVNGGQYMV